MDDDILEAEEKKKKSLSTSKFLSRIRALKNPDDVLTLVQEEGEPNFSMVLYKLMEDHKLTPKDMIKKSQIERSYFYHILSGKKTNPSRNVVLRIGISAGAGIQDMNRLLRLSGSASLYPRIRRDALLIHSIDKKLDMEQTNLLLLKNGETPLYRDEIHGQTQP